MDQRWIKDGRKKTNMWKSKNQLVFVQLASNHLSLLNGTINIPLENLPENIHSTTPRKVLVYILIYIYIYYIIYAHALYTYLYYTVSPCSKNIKVLCLTSMERTGDFSSKIIYHTTIVICIKKKKEKHRWYLTYKYSGRVSYSLQTCMACIGWRPGVPWRFPSCTAPRPGQWLHLLFIWGFPKMMVSQIMDDL